MRISVIGTGYLGAVHAAGLAELGHEVWGVDIDSVKLDALRSGRPPVHEPGFSELLARGLHSGRLHFTDSFREAAEQCQCHFLCVGTPQLPASRDIDTSGLHQALERLLPHVKDGCVVIGKSTVPPGTATTLQRHVNAVSGRSRAVEIAWNPEFLREGFAVHDTLSPHRIVVGAESDTAQTILRDVYAPLLPHTTYMATNLVTAELVKLAANSFLATKLSFMNAVAEVCEEVGGDVTTVSTALGRDPRIGADYLTAGLGFGGGCLSKDLRAFTSSTAGIGAADAQGLLKHVDSINTRCRYRTVETARKLLGGTFVEKNVAVLGAAFKPDTDDVRDSPALAVASAINDEGGCVRVHDPQAIDNAREHHPELNYAHEVRKACEGADITLHVTAWHDYSALDAAALAPVVKIPVLLDARNSLDLTHWRCSGWTVHAVGRKQS